MANATNINIPSGWVRAQNYPQFNLEDGVWNTVDQYYAPYDEGLVSSQAQALIGTQFDAVGLSNANFSALFCKRVSLAPKESTRFKHLITLTYSPLSGDDKNPDPAGGATEAICTLEDGGLEMPLDSKKADGSFWVPEYKTCWLHELHAKCEIKDGSLIEAQVPGWWGSATTNIITGDDAMWYRWVRGTSYDIPQQFKDLDKKTYIWKPIKERLMRAEAKLIPSPIVVEKVYYKDVKDTYNIAAKVGKIAEPEERFGVSGGAFLVTSASVYKDGKLWCAQRNFTWAPGWDTRIYEQA